MKIKNLDIESFGKLLYSLKLKGKDSRMRTRMVNLIDNHLKIFNEERTLLIEENAQKNEDGSLKFEQDSETSVLLKPEKIDDFNREFILLLNEELIIEETESNKDMILSISNIMSNLDLEFSEEEAIQYDMLCEIFEKASENYSSKVE